MTRRRARSQRRVPSSLATSHFDGAIAATPNVDDDMAVRVETIRALLGLGGRADAAMMQMTGGNGQHHVAGTSEVDSRLITEQQVTK